MDLGAILAKQFLMGAGLKDEASLRLIDRFFAGGFVPNVEKIEPGELAIPTGADALRITLSSPTDQMCLILVSKKVLDVAKASVQSLKTSGEQI
jgi:hypothetical protein